MAVKTIDFSCKHDCMIQNSDGSLSRMDEPYFEAKKIAEGTWQILSSGDFSYLVEGEEEAVAIDTGYGAGNIREYMQSLTSRPLRCVINTHDHFDHTANNGYFDRAYMGAGSIPLATVPFPSFAGIDFPTDYERIAVGNGYVFHLGGRDLEVFELPDHAAGSILLLDRKERILFSGDEFHWQGKNLNGGLTSFMRNLERIYSHRAEFDRLCGGPGIFDAELVDQLHACGRYILDGHEGETFEQEKFSLPLPKSPDEEGRTVYHRQLPHPEDMHHDAEGEEQCYRRRMAYAGTQITYDIRKRDL